MCILSYLCLLCLNFQSDWPLVDVTEATLELDEERNLLGTQDEIVEALREHARILYISRLLAMKAQGVTLAKHVVICEQKGGKG